VRKIKAAGGDHRAGGRHGAERDDDGEQTDKRWPTMTASSRPRPISWWMHVE